MRWPQIRLKTVLVGIVFLALFLALVLQTVQLQQAKAHAQRLQAELHFERVRAAHQRALAGAARK